MLKSFLLSLQGTRETYRRDERRRRKRSQYYRTKAKREMGEASFFFWSWRMFFMCSLSLMFPYLVFILDDVDVAVGGLQRQNPLERTGGRKRKIEETDMGENEGSIIEPRKGIKRKRPRNIKRRDDGGNNDEKFEITKWGSWILVMSSCKVGKDNRWAACISRGECESRLFLKRSRPPRVSFHPLPIFFTLTGTASRSSSSSSSSSATSERRPLGCLGGSGGGGESTA